MSVTANCSLVIKNVTADDFGEYFCREELTDQKAVSIKVDLTVTTMTEQRNNETVTFNCSVPKHTYCRHRVVWLFEGKEQLPSEKNVSASCSAAITIPAFHLHQNLKFYELLKCKVQQHYDGKDFLFSFSRQHSGEKTGWFWWAVVGSVVMAGLLITVIVIITLKKTKGDESQLEEISQVDPKNVSYASISFSKRKSKLIAPVPSTVTYSTLNASSPAKGPYVVMTWKDPVYYQ
ncbi:uncharacterized protein V3H82_027201 [Fundulus diaphanus]